MEPAPTRPIAVDVPPGYAPYQSGAAGHAHNEAAFRHFLGIELRRAARLNQSVLLVLISRRSNVGASTGFSHESAGLIFAALGASVREVDFVGWFREQRVASAALIQRGGLQGDARLHIMSRVTETLRRHLPNVEATLRVRVAVLGGR